MINKILITKDAVFRGYLPIYGNEFWEGKTPNIDCLAHNGTVFMNHYTGAPSTIMACMCMCTGEFSFESELDHLYKSYLRYKGKTIFDMAEELGYECHIIWDLKRKTHFMPEEKYYCYGERTKIHYVPDLAQSVGAHHKYTGKLERSKEKTEVALNNFENEIKSILCSATKPVFLWFHVPHVINGRISYGDDFDTFDDIVGIARKYFDDGGIYISADHGNMNGVKGKLGYGFDVYQPAIQIPLITPRLENSPVTSKLTCNVDLDKIIFNDLIPEREYVYCDSAFYAQPQRKLAILTSHYKYIYNKASHKEELYDLQYDPHENCNLIEDFLYDKDRGINVPLRELYFYNNWDETEIIRNICREKKEEIWRVGSFKQEFYPKIKAWLLSRFVHKLKQK